MVRDWTLRSLALRSSPHPRGDGPLTQRQTEHPGPFSPPAWGWSALRFGSFHQASVLPTRVGMVRNLLHRSLPHPRSPHPRGDGPKPLRSAPARREFSPPAWGWSAPGTEGGARVAVLPTRVGMVRGATLRPWTTGSSPHPRGDGPDDALRTVAKDSFSPPAWGWSARRAGCGRCVVVLPTRVGMVR